MAPSIAEGLVWGRAPDDLYFTLSGLQVSSKIADDVYGGHQEVRLRAQSSESLAECCTGPDCPFPVAVVTDPPYYGNVMYAELSDFFYIYLHAALREQYPRSSATQTKCRPKTKRSSSSSRGQHR